MANLIEVFGWGGALAVLLAYALVSSERMSARSRSYQLLNVGGAVGLEWRDSFGSREPDLDWHWRVRLDHARGLALRSRI